MAMVLAVTSATSAAGLQGVDVSNWSGDVDWVSAKSAGATFAYIQATEGVDYVSPRFAAQFGGAGDAGLYRGAYHFAQPHESGGRAQADYFVAHGGLWTNDGKTLPGVLDLEDNPYQSTNHKNNCYGLTKAEAVRWIADFTNRYRLKTGRDAIIYTTTSWWQTCTGDSAAFKRNPLWLANWASKPGALPSGWRRYTFWQSTDKGPIVGGKNAFNGTTSQLRALASRPGKVAFAGRAFSNTKYALAVANVGDNPLAKFRVTGRISGGMRFAHVPNSCKASRTVVRCMVLALKSRGHVLFRFTTKAVDRGPYAIRFSAQGEQINLKAPKR